VSPDGAERARCNVHLRDKPARSVLTLMLALDSWRVGGYTARCREFTEGVFFYMQRAEPVLHAQETPSAKQQMEDAMMRMQMKRNAADDATYGV